MKSKLSNLCVHHGNEARIDVLLLLCWRQENTFLKEQLFIVPLSTWLGLRVWCVCLCAIHIKRLTRSSSSGATVVTQIICFTCQSAIANDKHTRTFDNRLVLPSLFGLFFNAIETTIVLRHVSRVWIANAIPLEQAFSPQLAVVAKLFCCYIFIYIYFGRLHQGNFDGKNMINDSYYGSLNILCTRYTMLFASSDQYCVVVVVVLDGAPDKNQLFWVRKKKGCLGFEHILLLLIVEWLW